ncbi:benzoate/H(+) symporter BenE family transporter [Roseomonas frigidaquae]|uniref:Benzoate/H(+) symporter BenE family transporter n=1 Tax=Falsiroseomonas frigidaquae TaxID=487318 RepID=A0ABX1ERC7_9PROT|nr:benzoate/H(+) symporter BenE family transporter [Falsiroseomonas frigidaquae]NKE43142.1 benzoate/H(+) symporter BenE family transporter [Falsiroseomonas frigidaquae]
MPRAFPPPTALSSAFLAALIGFGGTVPLVVQALRGLGASVEQTGSAVTALCLGIGLAGIALSARLRMPVVLAWSTPGAALLGAATPGLSWPTTIGVFLAASLMMMTLGLVPVLGRLAERIPPAIASAMLAGVLLPFCLALFRIAGVDPLLVMVLLVVFIAARRRVPLYALLIALGAGIALTLLRGDLAGLPAGATFGALIATAPAFDVNAILSIGLPLFVVTLVSQNLPGLVVLKAAGYEAKAAPLLIGTGLASAAAAPFGAHAVNLAAITAAICTSEEAHPDHDRRWTVGVIYGGFYLLLALFAPGLVRLFLALPPSVIAALTGLALIPALTGAIEAMLGPNQNRDPAMLTFLATASGLTLYGLGAAFWGLAAGFAALAIRVWLKPHRAR